MSEMQEDKTRSDGTRRMQHYGSGRQPWDDIKALGWGGVFAAGNVLKYLRRNTSQKFAAEAAVVGEDALRHADLTKARWYWRALKDLVPDKPRSVAELSAFNAYVGLVGLLTPEELALLRPDGG